MIELQELQNKVASAWELLKLDAVAWQIAELEAQTTAAGFWDNPQTAQKITKQLADLQRDYEQWRALRDDIASTIEMMADAKELADEELLLDIKKTAAGLEAQFASMEEFVLLAGEHDARDAYVSFHAGAGGVSQGHSRGAARYLCALCAVAGRGRLCPWHRPRRRQLPLGA